MGLRINHNMTAFRALRSLRISDDRQSTSLERLSTGLQINRAGDDPSGLVISEILRSQIGSLKQAAENTMNASNMLGTADASLSEVNVLLTGIRESLIFALNTGGSSREQIEAEQQSVDRSIEAIDRIAETTRFASRQLLNGASDYQLLSGVSSGIQQIQAFSVRFDRSQAPGSNAGTTYTLHVDSVGSAAALRMTAAGGTSASTVASGGPMVVRVTGAKGSEEVQLSSGATASQLMQAVNILRGNTGVYASTLGGEPYLISEVRGEEQFVRVEYISGTGAWTGSSTPAFGMDDPGEFLLKFGTDAVANLNGDTMDAEGNDLMVGNEFFDGRVKLDFDSVNTQLAAVGSGVDLRFKIQNDSGLTFQMGMLPAAADQESLGIASVRSASLGMPVEVQAGITIGGQLSSLHAGRENDLFSNPSNAVTIVDAAIENINDMRALLGAFQAFNIEPALSHLNVHVENLQASESELRDLDFAAETASFTRAQILFQAGTSVLAQANLIPQSVLQLLQ